MNYSLDVGRLRNLLSDFYHATGVEMFLITKKCVYNHDNNVSYIPCIECQSELLKKSQMTSKHQINVCKSGIVNVIIPFAHSVQGHEVYLFFSFCHQGPLSTEGCHFNHRDKEFSIDLYYKKLSPYSKDKLEGVINIANTLCTQFFVSEAAFANCMAADLRIKNFIDENYNLPLSINDIAKGTNISKSNLYRFSKSGLGCTPIEYLSKKRIGKAKFFLNRIENEDENECLARYVVYSDRKSVAFVFEDDVFDIGIAETTAINLFGTI